MKGFFVELIVWPACASAAIEAARWNCLMPSAFIIMEIITMNGQSFAAACQSAGAL
jgi:hypothetical protein